MYLQSKSTPNSLLPVKLGMFVSVMYAWKMRSDYWLGTEGGTALVSSNGLAWAGAMLLVVVNKACVRFIGLCVCTCCLGGCLLDDSVLWSLAGGQILKPPPPAIEQLPSM